MRIGIDKNMVEFSPESASERIKLEHLWKIIIDCNGEALKLSPVGEYIPLKNGKGASFYIEGLPEGSDTYREIIVDEDCTVYCMTCNKLLSLKKGDAIPICCGKIMEIVD